MEYAVPIEVLDQVENFSLGMDQGNMNGIINTVAKAATPVSKDLPDPIDYLKKIMSERGLRNKDLKVYIGSAGNVCSVLKRRKPLSLRMIRNLHVYLDIPAEILIQPYDCH